MESDKENNDGQQVPVQQREEEEEEEKSEIEVDGIELVELDNENERYLDDLQVSKSRFNDKERSIIQEELKKMKIDGGYHDTDISTEIINMTIKSLESKMKLDEIKLSRLPDYQDIQRMSCNMMRFGSFNESLMLRIKKQPITHHMDESLLNERLDFVQEILHKMNIGEIPIDNIVFVDEGYPTTGNINNLVELVSRYRLRERKRFSHVGMSRIFVAVHPKIKRLLGPYFVEDFGRPRLCRGFMTSMKYIEILKNCVIPELKKELGRDFDNCWYQQDSASYHLNEETINYLREVFGNRLISKQTDVNWPYKGFDLNVLDYYVFPKMQKIIDDIWRVNGGKVRRLTIEAANLINPDELKKAIEEFPLRLMQVRKEAGISIRYSFDTNIKNTLISSSNCKICNKIHYCFCRECLHTVNCNYTYK